jgi:hypothetical protein
MLGRGTRKGDDAQETESTIEREDIGSQPFILSFMANILPCSRLYGKHKILEMLLTAASYVNSWTAPTQVQR